MKHLCRLFAIIFTINFFNVVAFAQEKTGESTFVFQKFGLAIGLAVFFAGALYGILFLYKKYILNKNIHATNKLQKPSFKTPQSIDEAIDNFLETTKPN